MKKLLLLGGAQYLLPVIEEAHKLGLYVITCDYLPDNIAHKHSDEYRNVSIIDKDAVLSTARELGIDGIMSFACDPGVVTMKPCPSSRTKGAFAASLPRTASTSPGQRAIPSLPMRSPTPPASTGR